MYDLVSCAMKGIVTSRVSALAGCDRLVSRAKVIENANFYKNKNKNATITKLES